MLGVLVRVLRVFPGVHDLRHKGVAEESHGEQKKTVGEGERQRTLGKMNTCCHRFPMCLVLRCRVKFSIADPHLRVCENMRFFLASRWTRTEFFFCFLFLFLFLWNMTILNKSKERWTDTSRASAFGCIINSSLAA